MADTIQALQRFRSAFENFATLLGRLDEDRLRTVVFGGWSAADVAMHFVGCHLQMAAALSRLTDGLDPRDPDEPDLTTDERNARSLAALEGLTQAQLADELRQAFDGCYGAAEELTGEEQEAAAIVTRWIEEETSHYRNHTYDLRVALP